MSLIEAAVRGGVIALLLVVVGLAARDARRLPAARYGAAFALCAIAYAIESAPVLARQQAPWICAVRLLSISTPAVFWVWVKAQIDDPFVPSWRNWLPWCAMIVLAAVAMATDRWLAWRAVQYAALLLVGLGIWRTLAGRGGDLVEGRRRLRLVLALGSALYIATIEFITLQSFGQSGIGVTILLLLGLGGFAALSIVTAITRPPVPAAAEAPLPAVPRSLPSGLDPEETALLQALDRAMTVERAYREERCSIAVLAARLGIAEHRLRRLINQRLGHRNFSTYINGYRLAETTAALADPSQGRVPILTIALDAGFQSLGPFNRAFKAHTGMTPSEYRRDRLAEAASLDAAEQTAAQ
jgi:AraC-like DNA-binding protein